MSNTKMKFRPTFWMSLCTLLAIIVLLVLGSWQLKRLAWKRDLITSIENAMSAEPSELPAQYDKSMQYKPVRVTGSFIQGKRDFLFGRSWKGATGLLYLAPFEISDGRIILVNRGWVPDHKRDPATWSSGDLTGTIELVGMMRSGTWEGSKMFRPANNPTGDTLVFIEPGLVAKRLDIPAMESFYLDQLKPNSGDRLPHILATSIDIPNNHLQYAFTWFSFAFILLIIFLLRSRQPEADLKRKIT